MLSCNHSHDPDSSALAPKGVVCRRFGSSDGRTSQTLHAVDCRTCEKDSQALQLAHLHFWQLSSYLSARQPFLRKLQRLLLQNLRNPHHVSSRESGLDSFRWCCGRNIAPCIASVQQIAGFFLCLEKELRLLMLITMSSL